MSFSQALGAGEFRARSKIDFASVAEIRPTRGVFIAFEGGDGAGKSTQIELAAQWVESQGWQVVTTREPGGTELGQNLRQMLLHAGEVSARAEALLFAADRAQHVHSLILPALESGKVVLTDRFLASSVAYQGQGRDLGPREIRDLSLWATGGLVPNLTVLLDLDPQQAASRRADSAPNDGPDRLERAGQAFHQKVRREFLKLAAGDESWLVVDASQTKEKIAAEIRLRLAQLLPVMPL